MRSDLYADMARLELLHFWFRARRAILSRCLDCYQPGGLAGPVLDAGCGVGANLEVLSRFGPIVGIEPDHSACVYASGKFPGRLVGGRLETLPFAAGAFSTIALFDVLEHIEQQQIVLQNLFRVLKNGGLLAVTVPAFPHLWSGHDEVHYHRRRYRADELRRELENAGFTLIYLSYFNTLLYPLVACSRLLNRKISSSPASQMRSLPRWLNTILYVIFVLECLWVGRIRVPFGVSLIAIAKKS